jgi:hypothetical protein
MMRRTIERAAKATERRAARAARGIVLRWAAIALGGAVVTLAVTMLARTVARRRAVESSGPAPDAFGAGVRAVDEEQHLEQHVEPSEERGAEDDEAMPTDAEPSWPGRIGAAG